MTQACSAMPTWGAARPTPGASRIVSVMSSSSAWRYAPKLSTGSPFEAQARIAERDDGDDAHGRAARGTVGRSAAGNLEEASGSTLDALRRPGSRAGRRPDPCPRRTRWKRQRRPRRRATLWPGTGPQGRCRRALPASCATRPQGRQPSFALRLRPRSDPRARPCVSLMSARTGGAPEASARPPAHRDRRSRVSAVGHRADGCGGPDVGLDDGAARPRSPPRPYRSPGAGAGRSARRRARPGRFRGDVGGHDADQGPRQRCRGPLVTGRVPTSDVQGSIGEVRRWTRSAAPLRSRTSRSRRPTRRLGNRSPNLALQALACRPPEVADPGQTRRRGNAWRGGRRRAAVVTAQCHAGGMEDRAAAGTPGRPGRSHSRRHSTMLAVPRRSSTRMARSPASVSGSPAPSASAAESSDRLPSASSTAEVDDIDHGRPTDRPAPEA
mgnify:CR=1 FL=1